MKLITLFVMLIVTTPLLAQQRDTTVVLYDVFPALFKNLPTTATNSVEFPINKKFTIKLHTLDSIHFDYTVISFERFNSTINYADLHLNFSEDSSENGTIEIYFAIGINGEYQPPGDRSARVVWVMKNLTEFDLSYDIETQKKLWSNDFKPAANSGVDAGAIAIEKLEGMLNDMRLSNIRIKGTP
jgi:hypothetical protein